MSEDEEEWRRRCWICCHDGGRSWICCHDGVRATPSPGGSGSAVAGAVVLDMLVAAAVTASRLGRVAVDVEQAEEDAHHQQRSRPCQRERRMRRQRRSDYYPNGSLFSLVHEAWAGYKCLFHMIWCWRKTSNASYISGRREYMSRWQPGYHHRGHVDEETIRALQGKETGLRDHGELIKLRVVPYDQLWRSTADAKALSAIALYEMAKKESVLPPLPPSSGSSSNL